MQGSNHQGPQGHPGHRLTGPDDGDGLIDVVSQLQDLRLPPQGDRLAEPQPQSVRRARFLAVCSERRVVPRRRG